MYCIVWELNPYFAVASVCSPVWATVRNTFMLIPRNMGFHMTCRERKWDSERCQSEQQYQIHFTLESYPERRAKYLQVELPLQLLTQTHIKPEGTLCVFVSNLVHVCCSWAQYRFFLLSSLTFSPSLFLVLSLVGEINSWNTIWILIRGSNAQMFFFSLQLGSGK